ncbi:MAG: glycoside hydrolase family 2 TIM barrel-domain containing protein [Bacteroidales bacterium]
MKPIHWIIIAIILSVAAWMIFSTGNMQPRTDQKIDLNWRFMLDDDTLFSDPGFDDTKWEFVTVPHDWMIRGEVSADNKSGTAGGFYPGGIGWYRKHLDLSALKSKEQFYLVFDGVYMNAEVWVNGTYAGKQNYGYIGFTLDISDLVNKDSVNVIAVKTDCSEVPADRWYSGAGIYRHVKLIATNKLHFPVHNTVVTHEEREGERVVISNTEIVNTNSKRTRFRIRSDLHGPDGSLVSTHMSSSKMGANSNMIVTGKHVVPEPEYWSDKNPVQYELRSYLVQNGRTVDQVSTRFGIRDIEFSPDSGFILNGKKVWLKGVCIHHDGGELGAAVPVATWEYRLKVLKELGVNALRLAHNPHAPELLDMCDKMGFLVIGEMYDKWEQMWHLSTGDFKFTETYEKDLTYFIKRDINHPSIIAWSLGNETVEQLDDPKSAVAWYKKLAAITKKTDSSRWITIGLHPGYPERGNEIPSGSIHIEPLISYNYRTDSFAAWHEKYPELIWLASETKVYNKNRRSDFGSISYLENSWMDIDTFFAGQFIWAGIDYFGESGRWPYRSFYNGLLKTNAVIKPYAYYTQSIYSEIPMVKITVVDQTLVDSLSNSTNWQLPWAGPPVVRHWNFNNVGDELQLVVYSNCENVELVLNDSLRLTMQRSNFEDGVIKFKLPYHPGKIMATATHLDKEGRTIQVKDSLVTSSAPTRIMMNPDKKELLADGQDVVHIETSVTDDIGTIYPTANHLINYELRGPGSIRVIDNGDPADHTPYGSAQKRVYEGRQLLIVQSTLEPGDLIISATAAGLLPAETQLRSISPENLKH